jgi:signal transduction histidine kinase
MAAKKQRGGPAAAGGSGNAERLREDQQRLLLTQHAVAAGLWTWEPDCGRLTWSDECFELHGVPPDHPQSLADWVRAVHPDDAPRLREEIHRAVVDRRELELEYRVGHPQRGERWLLVVGREVESEDLGHCLTGIAVDITRRKRAEAELKALNEQLEQRIAERTRYMNLLQRAAIIANEAETVEQALRAALEFVCRELDWPVGHAFLAAEDDPNRFVDSGIWFLQDPQLLQPLVQASRAASFQAGSGWIGRAAASGGPHWVADVRQDPAFTRRSAVAALDLGAAIAFPILVGRRVAGVLEFFAASAAEPNLALIEEMGQFGTQLGRVVERKELEKQLSELTTSQQRRIGQELHDTVGQQLTGVSMLAASLRNKLGALNSAEADMLTELMQHIKEAHTQVRRLSRSLLPVQVDADGLMTALEELAEQSSARYGIHCTFHRVRAVPVEDNTTATQLYYIAQEAIANAVSHGQARNVTMSLTADDQVRLEIRDDGAEMPAETSSSPGIDLRIMRYRAGVIGGVLDVGPAEGGGTAVVCTLREEPRHDQDLKAET